MKAVFAGVLLCLMLCGCGVEPEDRSFVTAVGIAEDGSVCLLTAEGTADSEENEKDKPVIEAKGSGLAEAIKNCGIKSSGDLFFGHTMLCVTDKDIFKDKNDVRRITSFLEADTGISRRVIILAADDPSEILKGKGDGKSAPDFAKQHYRAHKDLAAVELDRLCRALAEDGCIVLPVIEQRDKFFEINGGLMLVDGVLKRELDAKQTEYISWLITSDSRPVLSFEDEERSMSAKITDKSVKVTEEAVEITVGIDTDDEENEEKIRSLCTKRIAEDAKKGLDLLQENGCDLIGMHHTFEKNGHGDDYSPEVFKDMKIDVRVSCM